MNRWLLNHFETYALMFVFIAASMLFAYGVLRLTRRFFPALTENEQNEITLLSINIIGAVYGILLGFVIVALWSGYNAASDNVGREASALSSIVRAAQVFPPEYRDEVTKAVGQYDRAVVDDEWPLLREGQTSPKADQAMNQLFVALEHVDPKTEAQKQFFAAAVDRLNDALSARRTRLEQVNASLPNSLRLMMYIGFAVIVAFMSVIGSGRKWLHTAMLLGVTAIIAFNLILTTTLDYPFSGDVSISDEPFRTGALAQFFTR